MHGATVVNIASQEVATIVSVESEAIVLVDANDIQTSHTSAVFFEGKFAVHSAERKERWISNVGFGSKGFWGVRGTHG